MAKAATKTVVDVMDQVDPATMTAQELQRYLEALQEQSRTVKAEIKRAKWAQSEAERQAETRRAIVLGTMLRKDRSDVALALVTAYLERIEHPQDRSLFGLAPRPDGMLGVAEATGPGPSSSAAATEGSGREAYEDETGAVDTSSEDSGTQDGMVTPGSLDSAPDINISDNIEVGDGSSDGAHDELDSEDDRLDPLQEEAAEGDVQTTGDVVEPLPAGNAENVDVVASATPSTITEDRPGGPVDGAENGDNAEPLEGQTSARFSEPARDETELAAQFVPQLFLSTYKVKDAVAALGFKKTKQGDNVWTVTATSPEEFARLSELGLKPYGSAR